MDTAAELAYYRSKYNDEARKTDSKVFRYSRDGKAMKATLRILKTIQTYSKIRKARYFLDCYQNQITTQQRYDC